MTALHNLERNVPVPLLGRPGPDDVAQALPNI
jgi:hypothetical protein